MKYPSSSSSNHNHSQSEYFFFLPGDERIGGDTGEPTSARYRPPDRFLSSGTSLLSFSYFSPLAIFNSVSSRKRFSTFALSAAALAFGGNSAAPIQSGSRSPAGDGPPQHSSPILLRWRNGKGADGCYRPGDV